MLSNIFKGSKFTFPRFSRCILGVSSTMPRIPLCTPMPVPKSETAPKPVLDKEPTVAKLSNGFRFACKDTNDAICTVGMAVKAGSLYENFDLYGRTSLLEKMAFRASEENTSFSINQQLERMGAIIRSESSRENIYYAVDVLRCYAPTVINLLAEVISNPAIYVHELNNAKFEYIESLKTPDTEKDLEDDIHLAAFGIRGLGVPMTASREMVDLMTTQSMKSFSKDVFRADRMSLSAYGMNPEEFSEAVQEHFGSMSIGELKSEDNDLRGTPYTGGEIRKYSKDMSSETFFSLAFHFKDGWKSKDAPALCILGSLLGGGSSFSVGGPGKGMHSRLYQRVLVGHPSSNSCNVLAHIHSDIGIFGITGSCEYKDTAEFAKKLIEEAKLMASPKLLTDEAFERAKNSALSVFLMNLESRSTVAEDFCKQLLVYGRVQSVEELKKKVESVTKADLLRVASELLASKPSVVVRGNARAVPNYSEIERLLR